MDKLLFATNNPAKLSLLKLILKSYPLEIVSLKDLHISEKSPELFDNETDNATAKSKFFLSRTGITTIADDIGLYVDALDGEPGVQFRRWNGKFQDENIDDVKWVDYLLKRLEGVTLSERTAKIKTSKVITKPNGKQYIIKVQKDIIIDTKPDWKAYVKGFPMSTLAFNKQYNKLWGLMTDVEKLEYEKYYSKELISVLHKIYKIN